MKLVLAPMANITHAALRLLIHRFADPDEYFTEMIHAPSLLSGGQFEQSYLQTSPCPERLVWQLTSHRADAFADAVPRVLSCGGMGIDVNMGCCAPPIVQSGAGFAWMLKPLDETAAMVRSVKQAITAYSHEHPDRSPIRLSVKLRLGQTEDYTLLLRFCRMLVNEGVELITLHPRLQRQGYGRPALHRYTAQLAQDLPIPVYGNGDIDSEEKYTKMLHSYPCAGWMIGRAAVKSPWIFKLLQATNNSNAEQRQNPESIDLMDIAVTFLNLLTETQPEPFHKTRAQRFFALFSEHFTFAHYCKTKLLNAPTVQEMQEVLTGYFEQVPDDRYLCIQTAG